MGHSDAGPHYILRFAAIVCALLGVALWVGPYVLRADLFADDAAQHTFWLYRFADPALFPDDLTVRFFSLPYSAPWGYSALYAAIAPLFDVLTAGEIVAGLLFLASLWLAWSIGRTLSLEEYGDLGGLLGVVGALWVLAKGGDIMTPLALQRSFALPIVLLFLWAVLAPTRYFWIGVSWVLAALIYPIVIVVIGIAGVLAFIGDTIRDRHLPPLWGWNLLAGLVAIGIVLLSSSVPPDIGPTVDGAQALAMPEFGAHGRLQLFFDSARANWFQNHLIGLGWSLKNVLIIVLAAILGSLRFRRAQLPKIAWIFLACGLLVWWFARGHLFTLYLPNRHARWTLAAFAIAAIAAAGVKVLGGLLPPPGDKDKERWRRIGVSSAIGAGSILVILALYFPKTHELWESPVDTDMERAYEYLRTLPRDTLVAAHPDLADFIPLRSRRSVLASTETSLPFMQGYYRQLEPRLQASLRAAYAKDWRELDAALVPYGVDVMVTAPVVWEKDNYYEPFDRMVAGLRTGGSGRKFVLQAPDPKRVLFRSGEVYVVRVGSDRTE